MENERLRRRLKAAEASVENLNEATTKGAKAVEYNRRTKQARGIITRLKREIPDRAIDRWVIIDEYIDALRVEYVRGSTETKFLISRVDPNFDFDKLEEVRAEELSKTASLQPAKTVLPEEGVPEDSVDKTDVEDSNDKVKVVGPTK
ncbi:hypothetical protein ACOSQ4_016937 [Xanthoceras sorbifolium]